MHSKREFQGYERIGIAERNERVRVMTYNVHSCVGTDRQLSPQRIAKVIADADPDVVCLQELDLGRSRTGRVDQTDVIARELRMRFHFHPAIRLVDEQYGDAILSKHPLELVKVGTLPTMDSRIPLEPRGVIWVEIKKNESTWQVLNTHFGLRRLERRRQAQAFRSEDWIGGAMLKPPVVVCGDLNSRPGSAVHRIIGEGMRDVQLTVRKRHLKTFATKLPFICLDFIYVSPTVQVQSSEVISTSLARAASDHFPLVANLTTG